MSALFFMPMHASGRDDGRATVHLAVANLATATGVDRPGGHSGLVGIVPFAP